MDTTAKRLCQDIIGSLAPFNLRPDSKVEITSCYTVAQRLTDDELSHSEAELQTHLHSRGLPEHTARIMNYRPGLIKVTVSRWAA